MRFHFFGGRKKNGKINLQLILRLYCTFIDFWVYFDDIRG
jgi:hypothetical protein